MKRNIILSVLALCCLCSCQKLSEKTSPRTEHSLYILSKDCLTASVDAPLAIINQGLAGEDSLLFMTQGSLIPAEYRLYDRFGVNKVYVLVECLLPGSWRVTENADAPFDVYGNISFVNVITLEYDGPVMQYRSMVNALMDDRNGYTATLGGSVEGIEVMMDKGSDKASRSGRLHFSTYFKGGMLDDAAVLLSGPDIEIESTTLND